MLDGHGHGAAGMEVNLTAARDCAESAHERTLLFATRIGPPSEGWNRLIAGMLTYRPA